MSMREVAGNYAVQVAGKALGIAVGLATIGVLTRSLGTSGFGEYTIVLTFLSVFGILVDFGLTLTLVQMIAAAPRAEEERLVGNLLGLRLLTGGVFYALAPLAALWFPYSTDVKFGIAIGAAGYLCLSTASMLVGVFQKHLLMWRFALAELVNRTAYLAFVGACAFFGLGLVPMVAGMVVSNLIWLVLVFVLARPAVRIRPRFETAVWRQAIGRSWPIALSILFNLVYLRGDIMILAHFRPPAEVGQYGVAYKVIDVLAAVPVMFMGLLLPKLTEAWARKNAGEFQAYMQKTFDFFAICAFPMALGAQAVSPEVIRLIAGPGYEDAGSVLHILIWAVVFVFLSSLYGHAVVAVEKQHAMIWAYAATALVAIAGYALLIPPYGMWGAAWITLISEALIALFTFCAVAKAGAGRPKLGIAGKALAASAVMYAALVALPTLPIFAALALGVIVYTCVLWALGGLPLSTLKGFLPSAK